MQTERGRPVSMPRSGPWKRALVATLVLALGILAAGGLLTSRGKPPIPQVAVGPDGRTVFTVADVRAGQAVFQRYGLMDYGSILGNGAYLGPDFTSRAVEAMVAAEREAIAREQTGRSYADLDEAGRAQVDGLVRTSLKANRYDPQTGTLTLTAGQVASLDRIRTDLRETLRLAAGGDRLSPQELDQLARFTFWTAWASTATRPGSTYSYTNNWPYAPAAGNEVTFGSVWTSAVSVVLLLLALAVILFVYRHYGLEMEPDGDPRHVRVPDAPPTPTQRMALWFLAVAAGLFLVQTLLGGYMAHSYVEPTFFGIDLRALLPFQVARSWHLQLAVFWIATAWMAAGLYLAPLLSGEESPGQGTLTRVLFGALIVVAVGSLLGEWLGVQGRLGRLWWYLGHQGWEYLELGRIWQVLLLLGLGLWLVIVGRGLRAALRREGDRGGLSHLLLYSAAAIPLFYATSLMIGSGTHITIADYWRWWMIHLWVEGIFEVFTVVVVAHLLTALGLVRKASVLRAVYFQLILLLGSGIVGTGHHYYWTGTPEIWLALGAVFSALEVIPLTLLLLEAYEQYRIIRQGGTQFPYRGTFLFLVATAVWNLVGAGGLGFLINLPVVNYFQHGTFLTPAHGHAALAGVYGMLAIALLLFVLRGVARPEAWSERLVTLSFWSLQAGLAGMTFLTLVPVGLLQLGRAVAAGYDASRSLAFYQEPLVRALLWLRIVPDSVFIALGVVPLLILTLRGAMRPRATAAAAPEPQRRRSPGREPAWTAHD
ncbi:nitric-oxide reductase large subunit [Caldinitratiruptor microaerophilus]|uniref:Nitric oxide reductase n=1 Tax=Caldinitratiruptor microaerophilus TaxID=671077 RepID=A0AA35CLL2_9FIRM|nr:cbb3-type cytochrome c oxidase subunit I [Caldinitratiruptor microaerophilus]BDG61574.1 nitric oxide reductase [Caldinitratiruptor microaerophilus]